MMNGDLTGKKIIPIVDMGDGTWRTPYIFEREWVLRTEEEIKEMERKIRFAGMYPWRCTYDEVMEMAKDPKKQEKLFDEIVVKEMERWMKLVEEKVPPHVRVIVNPGNDDSFVVDDVIKACERVEYPLGRVVYLDDVHPMISCEWVNPTPWQSPREEPEHKLEKRLEKIFKMVDDYTNLVCNIHCPPYDSTIDLAPRLDKDKRPILVGGHPIMEPVGSKAVRKMIEKYQPLLGLHAHIHESPGEIYIGRTLCINPGSEYDRGIFRAYIIDLKPEGIERYWRVYG
ncbi:phosphoesterase [Candidatus Bathyarchaeota archaeon]|nr:MAG: phosphoesterase [Candidatus Bathyarchaeota archaeon]